LIHRFENSVRLVDTQQLPPTTHHGDSVGFGREVVNHVCRHPSAFEGKYGTEEECRRMVLQAEMAVLSHNVSYHREVPLRIHLTKQKRNDVAKY
jgi:hypothetical protein